MAETTPTDKSDQTLMSVAFIKRKPDLTPEQFYHHWENVHGPLVKPWAEKHKIVGYTQVNMTKPPLFPISRSCSLDTPPCTLTVTLTTRIPLTLLRPEKEYPAL
jgi:hypothetical protein